MKGAGAPDLDRAFVRLAGQGDLTALMDLAKLSGAGMTNLPADAATLAGKIAWSERSAAAVITEPDDEYYLLVLDDGQGHAIGTASLFSRLGAKWPFYSYRQTRVTHVSRDLGRIFATQVLHLVNDYDGASEVGGLFLHPNARATGLGRLLARSRYLFIARHRERFGDRVVAELRGWIENGVSPFWEAIARPFFGRPFSEADRYNAIHGNQFIVDLMPRYPIYVTMLPEAAQQAIGKPHRDSVPALRLLQSEGFANDGYCDIFDGGPTLCARIDAIETVRRCRPEGGALVCRWNEPLIAHGRAGEFCARLLRD